MMVFRPERVFRFAGRREVFFVFLAFFFMRESYSGARRASIGT
jgi:hypothetical protein